VLRANFENQNALAFLFRFYPLRGPKIALRGDFTSSADIKLRELLPELDRAREKLEGLQAVFGNATSGQSGIFEEITKELEVAEKQIELVHGEGEKADQTRLSALNNYINAVSKLIAVHLRPYNHLYKPYINTI
jgi:predicted phosphodiesterase